MTKQVIDDDRCHQGLASLEIRTVFDQPELEALGRCCVTILEWLRTPPGKHGRATLKEIIEKIQCVKKWDTEQWKLDGVPLARLRAYSQEVVARAPSDTKRLSEQQQALQLCAFSESSSLHFAQRRLRGCVMRCRGKG